MPVAGGISTLYDPSPAAAVQPAAAPAPTASDPVAATAPAAAPPA
jgi:hypothetical protein